ncbi:MAG: hypothetical protein U0838_04845 [Chloroflexota bacterium]
MSVKLNGVMSTTTTTASSSPPYSRSGRATRSATRPPTAPPTASPPKKPVRMVAVAWLVLPKTRTSWRAQTTS